MYNKHTKYKLAKKACKELKRDIKMHCKRAEKKIHLADTKVHALVQ